MMIAGLLPALWAAELPAATLVKVGRYKEARAALEQRLKGNPADAEAHYLMSQVKAAFGDEKSAFQLAGQAVKLDASKADYHFQLARMYGERAEKAGMFSAMGLARSFRKEAEAALAIDPRHVESNYAMMLYYFKAPAIVGGNKAKAEQIPNEMMKWNAGEGWMAKARLAQEKKVPAAEIEGYYMKAAAADGKNYSAAINTCSISVRRKQWEAAEKLCRHALALEPLAVSPYTQLAIIFASQKRMAELQAILTEAEKKVPSNFYPYYAAGNVLLAMGEDFPRVEQYFKKYLGQEPEARYPRAGHARWRLGLLYEKQAKRGQAKTELEAAVRELPGFEAARKDLERMK